jgi:hypothetical protein
MMNFLKVDLLVSLRPINYDLDTITRLKIFFQLIEYSIFMVTSASINPVELVRLLGYAFLTTNKTEGYPLFFITWFAGYAVNLLRISIAVIFVSSFIFQPLVKRPISLIWLRIVESDKPVFTLVFGGVASIATAVSQLAKHLSV